MTRRGTSLTTRRPVEGSSTCLSVVGPAMQIHKNGLVLLHGPGRLAPPPPIIMFWGLCDVESEVAGVRTAGQRVHDQFPGPRHTPDTELRVLPVQAHTLLGVKPKEAFVQPDLSLAAQTVVKSGENDESACIQHPPPC